MRNSDAEYFKTITETLCRTGSILVSAAKFGSYVMGSDIDWLMLHGKSKPSRVKQKVREIDESIKANLVQYNLEHLYLDIFVGDFANCPLSDSIQFDSIITDREYLKVSSYTQTS
jgi:tRNA (guanine10-N2)-methyltransferase